MTTIMICDNNEEQLKRTYQFVTDFCHPVNDAAVKTIQPKQLSELLETRKFTASILIIETRLGSYNGITLARQANEAAPYCNIIYLCSELQDTLLVYETKHLYFVLKEQMETMLPKAIEKAIQMQKEISLDYLCFKSGSKYISLCQKQICYIKKEGRYSYIHTGTASYQCSLSIVKLTECLNPALFIRCHYGCIVNAAAISTFSKNELIIKEQMSIPIGRTFYKQTKDAYLHWIKQK